MVYVDFPKAGLGNLMLVWARARIFSYLNNLPMVVASWWGFRKGAWWRNERKKRLYWGYFKENSILERTKIGLLRRTYRTIFDPEVKKLQLSNQPTVYCFREITPDPDLFKDIRPHRDFIRHELESLLQPTIRRKLASIETPAIAVHIRRGDFKIRETLTPVSFFVDGIAFIRRVTARQWPVTVFTDAAPGEIADLLAIKGVKLATENPDIVDILAMAKSRFILLSQSSTFSYWAAFLSDAVVIKPEQDWQNDLRPEEVNRQKFEGKVNFGDKASLQRLEQALLAVREDQPTGQR